MSRDHYKGVPKRRKVVVKPDGNLDVDGHQRPAFDDPTPIDDLVHASRFQHQETISAATAETGLFGTITAPEVRVDGALLQLCFVQATDAAFRGFKIDNNYLSDASFHIHWTKSDDIDRSGTFSKWCVEYTVYDGVSEEATTTVQVPTEDLEYLDSGTTTRVVFVHQTYQ